MSAYTEHAAKVDEIMASGKSEQEQLIDYQRLCYYELLDENFRLIQLLIKQNNPAREVTLREEK